MIGVVLLGAGNHFIKNSHEILKNCLENIPHTSLAIELCAHIAGILEDDERTNAGTGSELNSIGEIECDASIVSYPNRSAASVGAVQNIRNPAKLCRAMLERSAASGLSYPRFLVGKGAETYANDSLGIQSVDLVTPRAMEAYKYWSSQISPQIKIDEGKITDTIGVIVVSPGEIAACSSSGGSILKHPGRIGPAAVLGGACEARDNDACISSGFGEDMLEFQLARNAIEMEDLQDLPQEMQKSSLQRTPYFGVVRVKRIGSQVYLEYFHTTEYMTLGYINFDTNEMKVVYSQSGRGGFKFQLST